MSVKEKRDSMCDQNSGMSVQEGSWKGWQEAQEVERRSDGGGEGQEKKTSSNFQRLFSSILIVHWNPRLEKPEWIWLDIRPTDDSFWVTPTLGFVSSLSLTCLHDIFGHQNTGLEEFLRESQRFACNCTLMSTTWNCKYLCGRRIFLAHVNVQDEL